MALLMFDEHCWEHDTGPGHPECPQRLSVSLGLLSSSGLMGKFERGLVRPATEPEFCRAHSPAHFERVREHCRRGERLDDDTPVSPASWEAACLAAGGLLEAADRIMQGEARRALCLVRPPGHHAGIDRSMGFCLFNNIAVAARHLVERHGMRRILVVDFDVHHGNGTQEIFYEDDRVLFFSIHRAPFYPGSGAETETGSGRGAGFTINRPLPATAPPERFHEVVREVLRGPAREFKPEFVLVSAGFDAHKSDPVGGLNLDSKDFGPITQEIVELARTSADGRVLSTLEGGYHLGELGWCVAHHAAALLENE